MIDFANHTYIHSLNPFAIQFTESFGIRWYGLAYLAGFISGYLIVRRRIMLGRTALKMDQLSDLVFQVAIGTIIGGRLGYCIFYSPSLFTHFSSNFPFWGALAIH